MIRSITPGYALEHMSALSSAESAAQDQGTERRKDDAHVPCMMCHDTVVLRRVFASHMHKG